MASSPQRRLSPQGPGTRAETERHGSSFHTKTKSSPPGRQKSASPSLCDVRKETYTAHPELPDSQKGSREEELFPPAWPRPAPPPGARRQTSPLTHRPRAESLGGGCGEGRRPPHSNKQRSRLITAAQASPAKSGLSTNPFSGHSGLISPTALAAGPGKATRRTRQRQAERARVLIAQAFSVRTTETPPRVCRGCTAAPARRPRTKNQRGHGTVICRPECPSTPAVTCVNCELRTREGPKQSLLRVLCILPRSTTDRCP